MGNIGFHSSTSCKMGPDLAFPRHMMEWLELLILEAFPNLDDSVILCDSENPREAHGVRLQLPHSECSPWVFSAVLG